MLWLGALESWCQAIDVKKKIDHKKIFFFDEKFYFEQKYFLIFGEIPNKSSVKMWWKVEIWSENPSEK